jgi:uncharacterized membrane protein (Fun14 family)
MTILILFLICPVQEPIYIPQYRNTEIPKYAVLPYIPHSINMDNFSPFAATIGGGFFAGILIGYALKKVLKILAIVVGLFFAGLAYLQFQQIVNIDWNKLQATLQNAGTVLANATTQISNHLGTGSNNHTTGLAISNLGIPLTGSMAMGFAIGFMKG